MPLTKTLVVLFQFQIASKMPVGLAIFVQLIVTTLKPLYASAGNCGETTSSIMHHALLGHAYNTTTHEEYPSCFKSCYADPKCSSCNYDLTSQLCELSSVKKEEAPHKFVKKDFFIYTGMLK